MKPAASAPVDLTGIEARLIEVPLAPGNYSRLSTDGKRLYFLSNDVSTPGPPTLKTLAIENKSPKPETFSEAVTRYELSLDRKKIMVRKAQDIFIFDVGAKAPAHTTRNKVPLTHCSFPPHPPTQ